MFTGIIETTGAIISASAKPGGMTLSVQIGDISRRVGHAHQTIFAKPGDSIAINGVCLTVTALSGETLTFDVSAESLSKTTLKTCRPGQPVNIERAMSADGRFGGHIVQGHIDAVGKIISIRKEGNFAVFTLESPAELFDQIVTKGSIALDGISLTVASISGSAFTVALIPETLSRTIWAKSKPGDPVNIETDILLKAVQKQLNKIRPNQSSLTEEKIRELGF